MNTKGFIFKIYSLPQTIFTLKEFSLIFPEAIYKNLKSQVSYFVRKGKIIRVRKGVYAKEGYNVLELANKTYTPSYVSFETVLTRKGVIFQHYETIFMASYLSRKININDNFITYRKIKNNILLNSEGIEYVDNYSVASAERAFLDTVFLYKNYHFDNLSSLNWNKITKLAKIYSSKVLEKRVKEYHKIFKDEYVKN